ncbi:MAG: carbon storage regulator CsrA [Phycisphaeraceae bacterium]|nr:carbon storage regulator CsrA [Phycisphaeraceae bacterium]
MLVLSRHIDESIMIGDEVELTIVDIRGDKVRIGINAPASVAVHRKEVYEAIRQENEHAARFRGTLDSMPIPPKTGVQGQRGARLASEKHPPRRESA